MYPVAATSAAAFSDVADNGGDNVDNKVCVVQVSGTSDSGLQQIEVPAAVSSTTTSNVATVRKGVGARGKAPARKSAAASTFTPDPGVFDSLGVELHPDSAQTVTVLLSKVDVLAKCIYDGVIRKQLPSGIVDKLTVTGQAVWYGTYRVLCEFGFVHRCLREYHAKHRPGFIRSLSDIKVLSNSSGSDVEMLSGDGLLSFLSKLDSAVRGMVERIFNSNWDTVVGKVFSALEEGSLDDVSCKDFKDVLDIAGVPLVASSLVSRSKTQSLRTHTSNEDIDESTASGGGPSSSMTAEEMDTGGACAGAGVVCATVDGLLPIQCVDLLGVRVHPDSTKPIYGLFSGIRESAKMSYSSSILNHLLTTINSELSLVGRAIWCETYRELHLCSFIFRFLCIYHYKYRPDFIRLLPSIRVLSSSSDCKLVPLSGGSLLGFLSKLDVAILDEAKSVFISHWDKLAGKVFVEGGSLIDVSCGDFVNALDVAGVPAVAFSYFQRRRVGKRKISENSSKVTSEGTTSEDGNTGSVGSSSGLQLQSELSSLPEPDLLLEGGSSLPNVADYVAATSVSGESFLTPSDDLLASTDDGAVSNLEVLEGELLAPSFSPELIPESLLPPSLELEQVLMPPPFLHHHWLEKLD